MMLETIYAKSEQTFRSFLPSSIRLWNDLPEDSKILNTCAFKHAIKNKMCSPIYYTYGNRKEQINLARLRMGCSNLNYHLFLRHLVDDPSCTCSEKRAETPEHFLFECSNHRHIRRCTIDTIPVPLTIDIALHGNASWSEETNKNIFNTIAKFISQSKRF